MSVNQFFYEQPALVLTIATMLGLIIGSFLNVVIYRLPKMMEQEWKQNAREYLELPETGSTEPRLTLSTPNSTCPHCGHEIKPWENIPVVSYLFLKGKCSNCKNAIAIRYPLIELITALLSFLTVWYFYDQPYKALLLLPLVWSLIALTMIDFDTQLLPDSITLPLLWAGLVLNSQGLFTSLDTALWGAVAGYMSLWTVYQAFKLLTGKEGMGYGDFKLLAALGAWMGWKALPVIILMSSVVGAVVGIGMILFLGRDKSIPIPFGPYLAAAGFITLIWGNTITQAYFTMIGMR
jgi:leader peptidase (prepilin peptidase)/N-methyltransferase